MTSLGLNWQEQNGNIRPQLSGVRHGRSRTAVDILADHYRGTLYIGVTSAFHTRMIQHREGVFPGFTKRYGLKRLVWYERYDMMIEAIQRERSLKEWRRQWKINLIERDNPRWDDLYGATFEWTPVARQV